MTSAVNGYFKSVCLKTRPMVSLLALVMPIAIAMPAHAGQSTNDEAGCQVEEITYRTNPNLTRAEQLAAMEKAFFDSLNRFETCNLSNNQSSASSDNSESSDTSDASAGTGQNAVPSAEMQGTESVSDEAPPPMPDGTVSESDNVAEATPSSGGQENGAVPEDIPSANNDDAIAAQIRAAAEAETDPEIREKLWNEYRKYKGMDIEQ